MYARKENGFTLIELLVVIAIIGILASVVLASLNTARGKGNDAKVQSQLNGVRSAAAIYGDSNNSSYGPVASDCDGSVVPDSMWTNASSGMALLSAQANYPAGATLSCDAENTTWAMSAILPSTVVGTTTPSSWCVDSTRTAKREDVSPAIDATTHVCS